MTVKVEHASAQTHILSTFPPEHLHQLSTIHSAPMMASYALYICFQARPRVAPMPIGGSYPWRRYKELIYYN